MKKFICLCLSLALLIAALVGCAEKLPALNPTYSYTLQR